MDDPDELPREPWLVRRDSDVGTQTLRRRIGGLRDRLNRVAGAESGRGRRVRRRISHPGPIASGVAAPARTERGAGHRVPAAGRVERPAGDKNMYRLFLRMKTAALRSLSFTRTIGLVPPRFGPRSSHVMNFTLGFFLSRQCRKVVGKMSERSLELSRKEYAVAEGKMDSARFGECCFERERVVDELSECFAVMPRLDDIENVMREVEADAAVRINQENPAFTDEELVRTDENTDVGDETEEEGDAAFGLLREQDVLIRDTLYAADLTHYPRGRPLPQMQLGIPGGSPMTETPHPPAQPNPFVQPALMRQNGRLFSDSEPLAGSGVAQRDGDLTWFTDAAELETARRGPTRRVSQSPSRIDAREGRKLIEGLVAVRLALAFHEVLVTLHKGEVEMDQSSENILLRLCHEFYSLNPSIGKTEDVIRTVHARLKRVIGSSMRLLRENTMARDMEQARRDEREAETLEEAPNTDSADLSRNATEDITSYYRSRRGRVAQLSGNQSLDIWDDRHSATNPAEIAELMFRGLGSPKQCLARYEKRRRQRAFRFGGRKSEQDYYR